MKTLRLFNAVIAKESQSTEPFISEDGYVIAPNALWAKDMIMTFYNNEQLSGNDLNKTFHASWTKIKNSTRAELAVDQILHYMSTYGTNFTGDVYIPNDVLNVPDVKLTFKSIAAYTKSEMTEMCLNMLRSGIALKEETLSDVLSVLTNDLDYMFTGNEGVKNKEAITMIADLYGVLPKDTMEFFRYIIYRSTGDTLLIKNAKSIALIKFSQFNPNVMFKQHGLDKLSTIFNRFKPLFLAYKGKCPSTINKIAKLSKTYHKPMVSNPLNDVTNTKLTNSDIHWLDNATPFALFKALAGCYSRINGQESFVYRIRNGRSWTTTGKPNVDVNTYNFDVLLNYLKTRFDFTGKTFYIPKM